MQKPLLVAEALLVGYRWSSERIQTFLAESALSNKEQYRQAGVTHHLFCEEKPKEAKGLIEALSEESALVVCDYFPTFFMRDWVQHLGAQLSVACHAVDACGILPLNLFSKAPYSAYFFRKAYQKLWEKYYLASPQKQPLKGEKVYHGAVVSGAIQQKWPDFKAPKNLNAWIQNLPYKESVGAGSAKGGRAEALKKWDIFYKTNLKFYGDRNHPDVQAESGLSPYLHFGCISPWDITHDIFGAYAKWKISDLKPIGGQKGYFQVSPAEEEFLDQLLTWREVGYHYCYHRPDYASWESLPSWARQTLEFHQKDPREWNYSLKQLEQAKTHDTLWNAAQRQLVAEGIMPNYLRMLWGKNLIAWTKSPQDAFKILEHLNNKYALDGRDPNSYTGIAWCFGRMDRPWAPAKPVFGTVRVMKTANTLKKLKLSQWLLKWGGQEKNAPSLLDP